MLAKVIQFAFSNFTLSFFFIGLICSVISLTIKEKPLNRKVILEAFFSYFLLFSIGVSFIYNFIFHVFFAEMSAKFIGWENSPFQYEVGFASLGFGIVGLISFKAGSGFRAAALTGPAFFLWGAAGGHIYQMLNTHNFSPGNAGVVFWTDIILPVTGFVLLYMHCKTKRQD